MKSLFLKGEIVSKESKVAEILNVSYIALLHVLRKNHQEKKQLVL